LQELSKIRTLEVIRELLRIGPNLQEEFVEGLYSYLLTSRGTTNLQLSRLIFDTAAALFQERQLADHVKSKLLAMTLRELDVTLGSGPLDESLNLPLLLGLLKYPLSEAGLLRNALMSDQFKNVLSRLLAKFDSTGNSYCYYEWQLQHIRI
jgi:hypothetical protein